MVGNIASDAAGAFEVPSCLETRTPPAPLWGSLPGFAAVADAERASQVLALAGQLVLETLGSILRYISAVSDRVLRGRCKQPDQSCYRQTDTQGQAKRAAPN